MAGESLQVVVALFNYEEKADLALKYLKSLRSEGKIDFQDAAVLRKERDGKLRVKETGDMSAGKGAGIGGLLGGVLGLVAGPAGLVIGAGTGAVIGGLAAREDSGLPDEGLRELGEKLEPGMSALVAIVSDIYILYVDEALQEEAVEVSAQAVDDELLAQLQAGSESAATKLDIGASGEDESK